MATITSIANKLACGANDTANLGKLGCLSLFGTPEHILALRKGTIIPADTVFNLAYLQPLIQAGTITPIIDASSFEDISGEDTYSTNSAGVKRLNLKGLPEFKFMYEEGNEFYRQLENLRSFKEYDFIFGDTEGNWLLATKSDGDFQGFSAGHSTAEQKKFKVQGGDSESKALIIQLLDRAQLDQNYTILHVDQLDFIPSEVPVVNGCHIEIAAVPANTDAALTITVHLNSDHTTVVTGLTKTEFLMKIDGATVTLGTVTETPDGSYSVAITSPAAFATGELVTIETFHGATNSNVADPAAAGVLFRAEVVTTTVIA